MMQKAISNRAITKTDLKKKKTIKANPEAIKMERQIEMRRTSEWMLVELQKLESKAYSRDINDSIFDLVRKRMGGAPLRAYFVQKIFDIHSSLSIFSSLYLLSNSKEIQKLGRIQIPFIFEMVISIQYLHNQILDKKANIVTHDDVNRNLLAANLLKDLLYQYIDEEVPTKWRQKVSSTVRECFQIVDLGQMMEKKWNTYEAFQQLDLPEEYMVKPAIYEALNQPILQFIIEKLRTDLPREKWEFAQLYLQRIHMTCGILFVIATQLLIDIQKVNCKNASRMLQFAHCYGILRQMVNDNADNLPSSFNLSTNSKAVTDAFSDFRNRNITLPILLHFTSKSKNETAKRLIEQSDSSLSQEEEELLFQEMLQSSALFKAMQYPKILVALCQTLMPIQNKASELLLDTCSIVHWNKFLFPVKRSKQYKRFKKTAYYRRTKRLIQFILSSDVTENVNAWRWNLLPKHIFSLALKPFSAHNQL